MALFKLIYHCLVSGKIKKFYKYNNKNSFNDYQKTVLKVYLVKVEIFSSPNLFNH